MPKKQSQSPSRLRTKEEHEAAIASYRKNSAAQLKRDLENCPKGISKKYLASLSAGERQNVLAGLAFDGSEGGGVTMEQSIKVLLNLPKSLRKQYKLPESKPKHSKESEPEKVFQYFVDAYPTGRKRFAAAMKIRNKKPKKHP